MREQLGTQCAADAYDEMRTPDGGLRPAYEQIGATLDALVPVDLEGRAAALMSTFTDRGVTFNVGGGGDERPFPLDLVPRVLTVEEWQTVEAGVRQRVRALEAFLADVYGPGRCFEDGVVPRRLVTSSRHFHRAAHGIVPVHGVRIHVAGIDLVRDAAGQFRVLEDNVRVPSGVSYVIENRRAMSRVLPDVMARHRVRPVSSYPSRLLGALRRTAPPDAREPTVVVLTPGAHNSAYFEHSLLARLMGVELVEGRDLYCRANRVFMRTTTGERRVDVIYRRVDDDFLDPLQCRPESMVGCAGIVNAVRAGNVTLANAIGNGVADDKLAYTWVPQMVRYYLAEEPLLPNVDTYRVEFGPDRDYVLEHLAELVLKPVDGSGGYGIVIGPAASKRQLAQTRRDLQENPRGWIAQPVVQLSTVPTLVDGRLAPRHVDLRPFAINDGDDVWVLPGGLTRVALPEGSLIVNSSQGGGSKDTWVLAPPGSAAPGDTAEPLQDAWPAPSHPAPPPYTPHPEQQQQARSGDRPC
jgi:uncharacterized circularly permuted ATP-grasp superfamily protein